MVRDSCHSMYSNYFWLNGLFFYKIVKNSFTPSSLTKLLCVFKEQDIFILLLFEKFHLLSNEQNVYQQLSFYVQCTLYYFWLNGLFFIRLSKIH